MLSDTYKSGAEGAFDTLIASAARTTSGNGTGFFPHGPITGLVFQVNVTAVSGTTPTLIVKLQDTVDGTNYNDVTGATTASINATGLTVVRFNAVATPVSERLRFAWVVGGTTPSFTFAVDTYTLRA